MKTKRWTKKDLLILEARKELLTQDAAADLFVNEPLEFATLYDLMITLYKKNEGIYFAGNIPSLKNSREIMQIPTKQSLCCKAGMIKTSGTYLCSNCMKPAQRKMLPSLGYSSTVNKYISHTKPIWLKNKMLFDQQFDTSKQCVIGLYFIRDSNRMFDYHNAEQIVGDLMAQYGYINDDNTKYLKIIPIGHHVNSSHSGMLMYNLSHYDDFLYMLFKYSLSRKIIGTDKLIESYPIEVKELTRLAMLCDNVSVQRRIEDLIDVINLELRSLR